MKTLLVLDVDGTLLKKDNILNPKVKSVLRQVQGEHGYVLALNSGRVPAGLSFLMNELDMTHHESYIIAGNGSWIQRCDTKYMLYERNMYNQCLPLYVYAQDHDLDCAIYEQNNLVTNNGESEYAKTEAWRMHLSIVEDYDFIENQHHTVRFTMYGSQKQLDCLETDIRERFCLFYTIVRSDPHFMEFTSFECSKGQALAYLQKFLGVNRMHTMVFGDSLSDLEMFEYADTRVAMAQGDDSLKAQSTHIVSDSEDGLVSIIRSLCE